MTAAATSGDNANPNGPLGTFSPLFPTGLYFGQGVINLNGPSNLIQINPQVGLQLTKSVMVVADNNIFLADKPARRRLWISHQLIGRGDRELQTLRGKSTIGGCLLADQSPFIGFRRL